MTLRTPSLLSAARRQHFPLFLIKAFETLHPGDPPLELAWYLQAICHALAEVRAGHQRRLVVTVPPRHLKSVTASVAFVAWVLGHDPKAKIMVASYSHDLARLHSNQTRTIMESEWYRKDFPRTRISERGNRALELETTAGGVRKAVSVAGSITGFGADIIIVDDCMKADEAKSPTVRQELRNWFDNTLLSRLNDKARGRIISIQQRLHEDDLPAYMLEKGYPHLNLPAIAEKDEVVPVGQGRTHTRCGSAWKKDPGSGVIGVEKGPLIPVV